MRKPEHTQKSIRISFQWKIEMGGAANEMFLEFSDCDAYTQNSLKTPYQNESMIFT